MTVFTFLVVAAACLFCSLFFLGSSHILTGTLSGIFISLTSLLFLSLAIKKFGVTAGKHSWGYFVRSFVVRLGVAGGLLFLFICILKVNTIGILAGLLTGLALNTVVLVRCSAKP